MATITFTISRCRRCGDAWMVFPSLRYAGCLTCDFEANRDAISAREAQAQGIDVAQALKDHTAELRRNKVARVAVTAGMVVKAIIDDWGCKLERLARGGVN